MPESVELTMVIMTFIATDDARLSELLAKYVVLTRGQVGCRNVDLCVSSSRAHTFVVLQKWTSRADQQAHFDSPVMVGFAEGCRGLLAQPPVIDLLDAISAHDLA